MSTVGFLKYPDTRLASSLPPSGFCIDRLQQMVMLFAFCVRVPASGRRVSASGRARARLGIRMGEGSLMNEGDENTMAGGRNRVATNRLASERSAREASATLTFLGTTNCDEVG